MFFNEKWFNTDYYSVPQLILFGIGAVLWLVCYIAILRDVIKLKYIEMPAAVLCGNFAWEFLWGFIHHNNMGKALELGYMAWFFLDAFIVYNFFKYGYKQIPKAFSKQYKILFGGGILCWGIVMNFFAIQGFDNPIGANSAYVLNILISLLYVLEILRIEDKSVLNKTAAWTKWWGTAFISIMCAWRWPDNYFVISMSIICFVLDTYYFILFRRFKRQQE